MRTVRGHTLMVRLLVGFSRYTDQNKVWYVNNYAWGNYESGGTITVTCLNLPGAGI